MPGSEGYKAENLLNNLMETLGDNVSKQKGMAFFEEENKISAQMNKLFGRQKTIHKVFGGGKSADVLLWRNKKISASVLVGATITWVLFEWLNYHFLTLVGFVLIVGMVIQFILANASGLLNRSKSEVPRVVLPNDLFVNLGVSVGSEVNLFLGFLQDVSTGRNLKQFLLVVVSLWAAAVIGSWCNFLTVLYIGFIAAHTLPVLYERYEDQVDDFFYKVLGEMQRHYQKLDAGLLSKIPKGNVKGKKRE